MYIHIVYRTYNIARIEETGYIAKYQQLNRKQMETNIGATPNVQKAKLIEFTTYVRTLQYLKLRHKGEKDLSAVHIPQKEIESNFFPYPQYNRKKALLQLIDAGEIRITETIMNGHKTFLYEALKPGAKDLSLMNPREPLNDSLHIEMRKHLKAISYPQVETTEYFDWFLQNKDQHIEQFFTVDKFAGRVHTPVTNLHRPLRPNVLLYGCLTTSFDVVTMQPLLLGKILLQEIGANEYSAWINEGVDIYIKLQQKAGLSTRDEAKKRFFEIIFSKPSDSLVEMFGASNWITWINNYKRLKLPQNPHNIEKPHSNLAWLLQTTEVSMMKKVWVALYVENIPFLTVHDEIIVKIQDSTRAESLFESVLKNEFEYYKLNNKSQT